MDAFDSSSFLTCIPPLLWLLSEEEEAIAIIRSALERAECAELAEEVPRGAAHA